MINKLHKDRDWQTWALLVLFWSYLWGLLMLYGLVLVPLVQKQELFFYEQKRKRIVFIAMVLGATAGLKLFS